MYCVIPHSHALWTLVCPLSLLQSTIKLTFAEQHSQQTDHLDAYKPKPEIKVCMQFRAVKCGVVRCGVVVCDVVWRGVVWCVVVWCVVCVVLCDVSCVLVECGAVDVPACPTLNCTRCGLNTVADAPSAVPSSEPLPLRAPPPLCQPTKCPSSLYVCSISSENQRSALLPLCQPCSQGWS